MLPPHVFRQYDIRGNAERDFDPAFCRKLGRALAQTALSKQLGTTMVVGRDCRLSSPRISADLIAGLLQEPCEVIDVGFVPTPALYFATKRLGAAASIMVTGSHNPKEDNGFKITMGGRAVYGEQITGLRDAMEALRDGQTVGTVRRYDVDGEYLTKLQESVSFGDSVPKVVTDCGNGAAGPLLKAICSRLEINAVHLYAEPDGNFPNHHPDPSVPENLEDLTKSVLSQGAALGLALDGDGDRLGVIDNLGRVIWGDRLTLLLAREVLKEHPGATIIGEVKCSQELFDGITEAGGNAIMWKVGHSLIKEKMLSEKALLAGEMSGHLFFADRYYGYDDGIYAAMRLIELVSKSDKPLSAMIDELPATYVTPEIRIDCPDDRKFDIVESIKRELESDAAVTSVVAIDGVRVTYDDGWGLVRASNTQGAIVVRCEGKSEASLKRISDNLLSRVQSKSRE